MIKSKKKCWEQILADFIRKAVGSPGEQVMVVEELIEWVHETAKDEFAKGYVRGAQKMNELSTCE